jgi:hypothetical protein
MDNEDIRLQISNILDQVRTQPRRRAIEPALAVGEFLRSRAPDSEDEVQAVTEIAVDEQLCWGHPGMVEDAILALGEAANASLNSVVDRISAANLAVTACMVVDRLARLGRVTPDEQIGACSCADLLDDRLVRGHGRYPRRAVLLRLLGDGLGRVADHVRHLDLVARFKWAAELAATCGEILKLRITRGPQTSAIEQPLPAGGRHEPLPFAAVAASGGYGPRKIRVRSRVQPRRYARGDGEPRQYRAGPGRGDSVSRRSRNRIGSAERRRTKRLFRRSSARSSTAAGSRLR